MQYAGIAIGVAVLIFVGAWFWFDVGTLKLSEHSLNTSEIDEDTKKALQGGTTELTQEQGTKRYTNEKHGFSFIYPEAFSVSLLPELEGESILVRGADTEFQIFVSPFDEEGPITPARIRQDLPELVIKEPQQVLIGESKDIEALIFLGKSDDFGSTREVWFVKDGNLYQVIAAAGVDGVVGPVLESLRFQAE